MTSTSPTFTFRALEVQFEYGSGPNGEGPPRSLRLGGLRSTARVVVAGGLSMGACQLQIFGMSLTNMNDLSTLGTYVTLVRRNFVRLLAGNLGDKLTQVFEGTVFSAWADMRAAPSVAFNVIAHAGLFEQMKPVPPSSYPRYTDVAVIMKDLATLMELDFENSGVTGVVLPPSYFKGTAREQALACATAAGIGWTIDNGTLAIWPGNGVRQSPEVEVTPANGLVGYPEFTATGVAIRVLYNKTIRFGSAITIKGSLMEPANRRWKVVALTHDLACKYPGGPWFTDLELADPNFVVVGGRSAR